MSKKNLYLGGLLIILVVAAYLYNGPLQKWEETKNKPKNFLSQINIDSIDFIDVSFNGKATTLEKMGDKWKIGGTKDFYVEDSVAGTLLNGLKDAQNSDIELASENKDKKGEFDVNEEKGALVKLRQGDKVISELIIGKASGNFTSSYLGMAGDDKTYLVKASLSGTFARDDWYDKKIFSTPEDRIRKVRFQYPKQEFTIESIDGDAWSGTKPNKFAVTKEKINNILTLMSSLSATKIPAQSFAGTGLEKPSVIVQATGDAIDNTIMIGGAYKGDEGEEYFYAKKGSSDNIYLITKKDKETLTKSMKDLK